MGLLELGETQQGVGYTVSDMGLTAALRMLPALDGPDLELRRRAPKGAWRSTPRCASPVKGSASPTTTGDPQDSTPVPRSRGTGSLVILGSCFRRVRGLPVPVRAGYTGGPPAHAADGNDESKFAAHTVVDQRPAGQERKCLEGLLHPPSRWMKELFISAPSASYWVFQSALSGIDLPGTRTSMMDGLLVFARAPFKASSSSPYVPALHPWHPNTSDSLL